MAATSPAFTVRSRPRMISVPSSAMRACRFLISSMVVSKSRSDDKAGSGRSRCRLRSADAAFQRDADQFLRLDSELHRQLLQHFLDEAVHHQRDPPFLPNAALQAVEQLIL